MSSTRFQGWRRRFTRMVKGGQRREVNRTAKRAFGWDRLRDEQVTAIREVLRGRDVFVVMPTGQGKSGIYQVPGLLLDGLIVVVSPLVALQRDQVARLREVGAPPAYAVNAAQSEADNREAWEAVERGQARYLFLSPEQLAKPEVVEKLGRPALFVVDEAHCVSAWGHDFRPDYLRLGQVVESLGRPPVLALTATAGSAVRDDVVAQLGMRDPLVQVSGFDRPNLKLEVREFADDDDRRRALLSWVRDAEGPGLVYVATRKDAEAYAEALGGEPFHAGMRASERVRVQDAFMAGEVDVVVATSAFGMGIDKKDVRFVAHAAAPGSLDAYYQEIGRAGRDGEPAHAALFFSPKDLGLQRFFKARRPDRAELATLMAHVHGKPGVSADEAADALEMSRRKIAAHVALLSAVGALTVDEDGLTAEKLPKEAAEEAVEEAARLRRLELSRVEVLRAYAETRGCRRQNLLGYFGQSLGFACGNCDICDGGVDTRAPVAEDDEFPPESKVTHPKWGEGTVVRTEGEQITVLFHEVGYKTLSLQVVKANSLLDRLPAA
nr:ATP-dependent DNA helicase RecQ [Actinosynnema mirum]